MYVASRRGEYLRPDLKVRFRISRKTTRPFVPIRGLQAIQSEEVTGGRNRIAITSIEIASKKHGKSKPHHIRRVCVRNDPNLELTGSQATGRRAKRIRRYLVCPNDTKQTRWVAEKDVPITKSLRTKIHCCNEGYELSSRVSILLQ